MSNTLTGIRTTGQVWEPSVDRLRFLLLLFFFGFGILVVRAVDLMVLPDLRLEQALNAQGTSQVELRGKRGAILDRHYRELAVSVDVDSIFVDPGLIPGEELDQQASLVADALGMSADQVRDVMRRDGRFAWLMRAAPPERVDRVRELGLRSIGFLPETERRYPNGSLAAQLLGFVGREGKGLEGLERAMDEHLSGRDRKVSVRRDGRRRALAAPGVLTSTEGDGGRVVLTIDRRIQHAAELSLKKALKEHKAKSGHVVVLDARDGGILAMASAPSFDPNSFGEFDNARFRNLAVADVHEPGSTIKPLIVAAALDDGIVSPGSSVYCENGRYRIGKHVIRDHHAYDKLSVGELISKSSNIGTAKLAEQMGAQRVLDLYRSVGLSGRPGSGLPGESGGLLADDPRRWRRVELANRAFGQGLAVSALQLALATSFLTGDGGAYRPHIVRARIAPDGQVTEWTEPERLESGLSAKHLALVRDWLQDAVSDEGTGRNARVPGYAVAGKTGTAQKVDPRTGTYGEDYWFSGFAGFLPAEEPVAVIVVGIDEPMGEFHTGGAVAAPVFREVAEATMQALNVPPRADLLADNLEIESADAAIVDAGPEADAEAHAAGDEGDPDPPRHPADFLLTDEGVHIPDLTRRSLRGIVTTASSLGLQVKVQGSGELLVDGPKPGSILPVGAVLELTFAERGGRR